MATIEGPQAVEAGTGRGWTGLATESAALGRAGWRRLAGFAVAFVFLAGLAVLAEGVVLFTAFRFQASRLTVDGVVTWAGTRSMLLQTTVVSAIVSTLLVAAGAATAVAVVQRVRAGAPSALASSLRRGLRRTPVVVLAGALSVAAVLVLLAITPVVSTGALLLLVLTPLHRRVAGRRARRRDAAMGAPAGDDVVADPAPTAGRIPTWVRWPSVRALVVAAIPLSWVAIVVTRVLLVLPAAVAIDGGLRATLAASARSIRGRVPATVALVGATLALLGALQFGLVRLLLLTDQTSLVAAGTIAATLTSALALVLVLTVAYHGGDVPEPTADPEPGVRLASAWRTTRRPRLATTALALALGGLAVLLPLVPASPAAAAGPPDAFVVDSLGDAGDADPGDGTCATATGTCTLRAAIEEGNTQGFGGDGNAITFALSGTVTVGRPLGVNASTTIDGTGRRVTIDGGDATQIFQFGEGHRWGLRALHVTKGRSDGGGGALYSGGPGVIDGVTFSANAAIDGSSGGAIIAYSSVTIVNSTFHANTAEGRGAAIYAGGSALISHTTFSGSSGPVWADFRMQLDDSIIESTGGQFACGTFGDLTGAGNVGSDDSCPGVPAGRPPLRLGPFGDHGGPVPTTSLTADSPARDAAVGTCPATDARGVPRPQGTGCDAGAVELDVRSATALAVDPSPSQPGQPVRLTATVTSNDGLATGGTVTFTEGATTLGTAAVSDGRAVLDLATLASGAHTLTATYGGNAVLAGSSGTASHQVAAVTTPVTISSSANPVALGAPVTFTVALDTASATPSGSVVLKDGATTLATLPVSSRSVTFTTDALTVGAHALTAAYGGDAAHGSGTSPTFTQTVSGAGVVTLTASPSSVVFANAVTLTAAVTSPDAAPPTSGTVRFQVEGTFTDVAVDGTGTATLVTSTLPPGTRTVYAQFLGGGGVGQSLSGSTTVTVTDAPSAVALTVTPTGPTDYGDEVTLAAVVTTTGTPAAVAGAVQFRDGTTLLGQVPLAAGRARLATTALGLGARSITATFVPATGFAASTSPAVAHRVDAVGTVVTLVSGMNPTVTGQAVTFTARVAGTGTTAVPTGSISFRDGTTELAVVPLDGTGAASLDAASLSVGSHAVTAVYSGATGFAADTSPVVTQVVTKGATTVDLAAPSLAAYGDAVTLTATVAPTAPAAGGPTGTVTFTQGTTVLGTASVVGGVATLVRNDLDVAAYDVTATYGGSSSFTGSTDAAAFEVYRRPTVLALAADRSSSTYGDQVTLVATATTAAGIVPTGTVVFSDQSGRIGAANVGPDGVARLTVDRISAGTRSLDAFLDSTRFSAGFARTTLTVAKATPTATLSVSPLPVVTDQQSILTLDLTGTGGTEPNGFVTFTLDGNPLQRVLFADGKAELGTVLPIGTHRVRASYEGNADYEPTPLVTVVVDVGRYVPTLIVRAEPADAVVGEPVTLHAQVRSAPGKPAATGAVTFERDQQPIGSGTIDAAGDVAVTVADLPLGTSTITVRYEGDDRYAESRQDLEVRVTRPATVTTLSASTATPRVGQSVDYTATVANPRSPVPPVGRLQLHRDGVLVAQRAVTPTGPSASATFPLAIADPGEHLVVATFVPDGSQVLGSSSAALTQTVSRYATATTVTAPTGPVAVGESVPFTVAVRSADAVDPGALPFRSQVVVSDGTGGTCTVVGGSGTCQIRISRPGPQTITASYAGDEGYAPSTGTLELAVGVGASRLEAAAFPVEGSPYAFVTGEPVRVSWTVGGPTTGAIVVTTAGGRVWCRSTVEAGSCTNAFSLDELGSPVLTVAYAGTDAWGPATARAGTLATLSGCFPIRVGSTTVGRGTVGVEEAPNCAGGTGHREGTFVTVVASPAAGFATEGFDPAEVARIADRPDAGRFLVSRNGPATLQGVDVRFGFDCVSLTQTLRGPVDLGTGAQGSAACTNRSAADQNGDLVSWWRRGTAASIEVRGAFARSDVQGRIRYPSDFQAVAYQLDDDSEQALGQARYVLRYQMDDARESFTRFGAPCFTLGLTTSRGGGTASASSTNCTSALGAAGYAPTTPVTVTAKGTALATFKEWVGGPDLPAGFSANGPTATFAIRSDSNVVANFTACYRLTTGIAGFPEDATLTVVTAPTCANGQAGWYAEGTDVDLTWRTAYFTGWATDQPSTQTVGSGAARWTGTARFRMDRDKAAMLEAPNPRWCSTLAVSVEPEGAGTGTVEGLDDPAYPCPAGQYAQSVPLVEQADPCLIQYLRGMDSNPERSRYLEELYVECTATSTFKPTKERRAQPQEVSLEAAATAGDPLLGWSYETSSPTWVTDPTREAYGLADPRAPREDPGSVGAVKEVDIFGATTATAWVCQQIDAKVALTGPNGTAKGQAFELGSEYIAVDPPPNCPIAANAWTVGTTVRLAPSAPAAGYTFNGWSGAYTGPDEVIELELDGASPSVRIDASYSVTCHQLGRSPRPFTSVSVEPNCPDPDPVGDWYIGGTRVGLTIKDRGSDFVFRGWSGAAGTGNPTYVVMDADQSVTATWTEKNGFEKAIDWIDGAASTVGTFLSESAVAYADAMQEAGKVMIAIGGKALQIGWGMFFDQTFGAAALPLNALRLINLALGNDDLATFIDQYEKVLGVTNMPGLLLGCATDSILGLLPPKDPTARDTAIQAGTDAKEIGMKLYELSKTAEELQKAQEKAKTSATRHIGPAVAVVGLGYGVGTSLAEGRILTAQPQLNETVKACIEDSMPTELMDAVGNAVT